MPNLRPLIDDLPASKIREVANAAMDRRDVLAKKSMAALAATGCDRLVVAGGVGANTALRERLRRGCDARGARLHFPELALCTDNGAMIALAAAMRLERGVAVPTRDHAFDVLPRWPLVSA